MQRKQLSRDDAYEQWRLAKGHVKEKTFKEFLDRLKKSREKVPRPVGWSTRSLPYKIISNDDFKQELWPATYDVKVQLFPETDIYEREVRPTRLKAPLVEQAPPPPPGPPQLGFNWDDQIQPA